MAAHNEKGKWGERVAAAYLERHGYVVRETDWRFGKRDLDIIAVSEDQTLLVVVEVKTRSDDGLCSPLQAVDRAKMRNIAIATNMYVKQYAVDMDVRFDIITVVGSDEKHSNVLHIEDAFNPLLLKW